MLWDESWIVNYDDIKPGQRSNDALGKAHKNVLPKSDENKRKK